MSILDTLEVVIGVIFVWLLVSMVVSSFQELVASQLRWRAKDLKRAIHNMLTDPETQKKLNMTVSNSRNRSSMWGRLSRIFQRRAPELEPAGQLVGAMAIPNASVGLPATPIQAVPTTADTAISGQNPLHPSPSGSAGSSGAAKLIGQEFYQHPLIKHISMDPEKYGPSYIPAGYFAEVLFDLIVKAGEPESRILTIVHRAELLNQKLAELTLTPSDKEFMSLVDRLRLALAAITQWNEPGDRNEEVVENFNRLAAKLIRRYPEVASTVQQLQLALEIRPLRSQLSAGVAAIARDNPDLGRTLNALVTRAIENAKDTDEAIANARRNVENWFDRTMERLSGHYKRRAQIFTLIVAFFITLFLNIDSLAIARMLWFNPTLRTALVRNVESTTGQGQPDIEGTTLQEALADLNSLQLPIGWSYISDGNLCKNYIGTYYTRVSCIYPAGYNAKYSWATRTALASFLGILLTTIAILPGAPFWFDMVSKLVNLRGSGIVPSSSNAEKDKK